MVGVGRREGGEEGRGEEGRGDEKGEGRGGKLHLVKLT